MQLDVPDRLPAHLSDQPYGVLKKWLRKCVLIPSEYRACLRHMETVGIKLGVLLSEIESRTSKAPSIAELRRPHHNAHEVIVSLMSQPRRLRTRSGPSVETIARKPSHFTSKA